ncbi:MAG: deoxyhypusine synthase [Candidatus Parvarchaeota archaeon]|nr:deoxyhypusine synthase [Candidatus Jingweiarchaeum tengchongense]
MEPVKDIKIKKGMSANQIIKEMQQSGGFVAKNIAIGVDILENMVKDEACIKFLSFPACIIATGTRGIIKELVRRKLFDVIITTCGTLDHDLARIWKKYYHGSFLADDVQLCKKGIHRLGNIFVPKESYGIVLEDKLQPMFLDIYKEGKRELSTKEIVWEIGKRINNKDSIVYWCYKNKIPMFIPGITDGAFGSQLWLFSQKHRDFKIDVLKDESELADIIFNAKKTGALVIGGGISKHHVIWWNQFKEGLDYAVYITTAVEWDGSLSGARTREAISWGKIKERAKHVTIESDATAILPLMITALFERMD